MVDATLFIAGGFKNGRATSEVWAYYTLNEEFERLSSMKSERRSHTIYYNGQRNPYLVGGQDQSLNYDNKCI